jgi:predicted Zn-dependent protease
MRGLWQQAARRGLVTLMGAALLGGLAAGPVLVHDPAPAWAQATDRPVIIRDTEIENWIRDWTEPVMRAAGLNPDSIHFILVQDNNVNAFVAGGQNVFIYTGLLLKSENASEVVGVVAHELGHIRGGHLVRMGGALDNAGYESILGTLLGIGAAIVTGNGQVGAAVASGTQSAAAMKFLSFSRVQESSADQAGLSYLERAGFDPQGLVSFMEKLEDQELLPASQQSAYIRTHPLTRDRVEALEAGRARSANKDKPPPAEWAEQHARMKAKLIAFMTPERVAWDYSTDDKSMAARSARVIAAYRQNRVEEALSGIGALLQDEPDNPFFLELKGQMLVDFGRVEESLPPYKRALELFPDGALIRIAYAHALIETARAANSPKLPEAVKQLELARAKETRSTRINRLLATAYGRMGDDAAAKVYLAEEALLKGETEYAKRQAEAALATLPPGSKHRLRAQDIISYIEQEDKKE